MASKPIGELGVRLGLDDSEMRKRINGLEDFLGKTGKTFQKFGQQWSFFVTAPLAGLAGTALKAALNTNTALQGAFGSLQGSITVALDRIGNKLSDTFNLPDKIYGFAEGIDSVISWIGTLDKSVIDVTANLALLAASFGPVSFLAGKLAELLEVTIKIGKFFSVNGVIVMGVAALGAGIIDIAADTIQASKEQDEYNQAIKKAKEYQDQLNQSVKDNPAVTPGFISKLNEAFLKGKGISSVLGPDKGYIPHNIPTVHGHSTGSISSGTPGGIDINSPDYVGELPNKFNELYNQNKSPFSPGVEAQLSSAADAITGEARPGDSLKKFQKSIFDITDQLKAQGDQWEANNKAIDAEIQLYQDLLNGAGEDGMKLDENNQAMKDLKQEILDNKAAVDGLGGSWDYFNHLLAQTPTLAMQVGQLMYNIFDQFSKGVGDAVGRWLIYGEDLAAGLLNVFKQIGVTIISTLISIGIQEVIFAVIGKGVASLLGGAQIGVQIGRAGAAGVAAAIETFGLLAFAGPAEAAGAAAVSLASAAAIAGKSAGMGIAAFAAGGIVSGPTLGLVGEAGTEVIAPLDDLKNMLMQDIYVPVYLDGREISKSTLRHAPGVMKGRGIRVR